MITGRRIAVAKGTFPAYAKINLLLKVFSKEPSGYHKIASVIARSSLRDDIEVTLGEASGTQAVSEDGICCHVELSRELKLHCRAFTSGLDFLHESIAVMNSGRNLAACAAREFLVYVGLLGSVEVGIEIAKRIPFGAGLGGGSADAAAVLKALDSMLETNLSEDELSAIGGKLGSDVSALLGESLIFIHGNGSQSTGLYARASGSVPSRDPDFWLWGCGAVLLKPCESVSTGRAYALLGRDFADELGCPGCLDDGSRELSEIDECLGRLGLSLYGTDKARPCEGICDTERRGGSLDSTRFREAPFCAFGNDFEEVIPRHYDGVGDSMMLMREVGFSRVLLAGSGSGVLGFCESFERAHELSLRLSEKAPTGAFVAAMRFV